MNPALPKVQQPVSDARGFASREWYAFFRSLAGLDGATLQAEIAALAARVAELEDGQSLTFNGAMSVTVTNVDGTITISLDGDNDSPGGNWYYGTNADGVRGFWPVADGVSGGYSITKAVDYGPYNYQGELDTPDELPYPVVVGDAYLINGDLWVGADDGGDDGAGWDNLGPAPTTAVLSLVNDEATPDPTHYYGTSAAGDKGWHAVSDTMEAAAGELTKAVDGDGVTTFGLADVADAGGGTLQRTAFDAKGRKTGSSSATTDDLAEGASNLYFTDERAQDATGAVLDDSGDVELRYETSPARRIWATLSSAVQSALSAAVSALQSGDNVSELVNDAGYTTNTGTVTSVGLNVPTGLTVSGSPITSSGTITVSYDTGYQGYTSAEASKLSGIASGATVGADWNVNLSNIPANIASWAGISPASKANDNAVVHLSGAEAIAGEKTFTADVVFARPGLLTQNTTITNDGTGNTFRSFSPVNAAKQIVFDATTDTSNTPPTGGSAGVTFRVLGITKTETTANAFQPGFDNSISLGLGSRRWTVVYAATGVINTSDAREKTPVRPMDSQEIAAAQTLASEIGTYQWLAAIEAKGEDARLHVGMTVQRAIEIMDAHDLNPYAYGFICYDQWDERPEIVEDGEIVQPHRPAGDRYSFRMDELAMFIARGQEERIRRLEQAAGL